MQWKKESQQNHDAFYVDLLAEGTGHWTLRVQLEENHPLRSGKSYEIALQQRNEGNTAFRASKWLDAIELYGNSLRFARPTSEHISLAYANHASCFLKLKMYGKCLKDIELAKEAGYPERLMPKLDQRKANCLQQMQDRTNRQRR